MAGASASETFYESQRRHRRASWRFSALSAIAVALQGLPLSVIISPFFAAAGLIAVDALDRATPMPDPVGRLGELIDRAGSSDQPGVSPEPDPEPVPPATLVLIAAAMVVPGVIVMGAGWLGVRRLFLRGGAGALALAAGARPPRPGDLEERQLVNLADEMALAAGIPPPRVLVLDSAVANAAVVGRSVTDCTLIVPRGLLDGLGRAPTGGIVADLLAVVVDGDLRVALVIASVFQTFDLVGAALAAPFSKPTRRVLWRVFRLSLRPRSRRGDGREEQLLAQELARMAEFGGPDDPGDNPGCVRAAVRLPFLVASIAFTLTRLLVGGLLVAPMMGALWRRRRLLADATAVELTRDPDALARGLEYLRVNGATVPAGPWSHLFVVGPEVARERRQGRFDQRRDEIWAEGRRPGESRRAAFGRRAREAMAASRDYRRELAATDEAAPAAVAAPADAPAKPAGADNLAQFLPALGRRLDRLAAMGARLASDGAGTAPVRPPASKGLVALGWVIGIPLVVLVAALFVGLFLCLGALIYLALLFELALVAPIVAIAHALLRPA